MNWARVKWSEAGQVLDLLNAPRDTPGALTSPVNYFETLRREGRRREAADFLGQALPRLEAVAWAARCVRDAEGGEDGATPKGHALRAALLWVQNPSENRRRAAFDAAQACGLKGPEALAALAVFFSGGSIAPPECEPVQAPRATAGGFAAVAVRLAAARARDADAALDRSLDLGAAMARDGISASP